MAADSQEFHYFGEYTLDGVVHAADVPQDDIIQIRDHLQYLEDDTVVATYPKTGIGQRFLTHWSLGTSYGVINIDNIGSGTTWTQEIIYCLQHGPGASERREKPLDQVFPYMETTLVFSGLEIIKTLPRPRSMKTHLHVNNFKRQLEGQEVCPKFVVVMRNPKDVLTSYYHFHKTWQGEYAFPKNWDYFFGMFQEKRLVEGDCVDHMLGWWEYRNHPRVLVVTYEDMKKDPKGNIIKVGKFLETPDYSDGDVEKIVEETTFGTMKSRSLKKTFSEDFLSNPADFFRQGRVGSWKDLFTADQARYVDELVQNKQVLG